MDVEDDGIDSDMPELELILEDENISDDEHGGDDETTDDCSELLDSL